MRKEFEVVGERTARTSNELGGNFSEFRLTLLKKDGVDLVVRDVLYSSDECTGCLVLSIKKIGAKLFCTLQIITRDPEEIVPFQTTLPGAIWFSK